MTDKPELERRTLVYVSCKMTGDSRIRPIRWLQMRFNSRRGIRTGIHLIHLGFAVIIPALTGLAPGRHRISWEDWISSDLEAVRRCDVLLRIPDPDPFHPSRGADQEVRVAHRNGIPVIVGGPTELLRWQHLASEEPYHRWHRDHTGGKA